MIRVTVYIRDGKKIGLQCKGHADSAPYGQDLVCAAVSSILTGGWNTFQKEDYECLILEEGKAEVRICPNEHARVVLETILTQLKTLEASYPENISIITMKEGAKS